MKNKKYFFTLSLILFSAFFFNMAFSDIYCEAASCRAIKGKNNWLFYNSQGDGTTLDDYRGINHYSSFGLERAKKNLLAAEKTVNQKGAEFVVFFAPNKETIYSRYMPKRIKRKTTYTRCDQLYDYLELNTDLKVAYPKEELLANCKKYELYYPNDTHWNKKGQFIGTQELLDITDGKRTAITDVKFKKNKMRYGDLCTLSYGRYSYYCTSYKLVTKVKKKDKSKKKVLLVGDSFAGGMVTIAKRYYKKATFCHINNFHMSMVKGYDVVVWEAVERYQDKFSRINFSNR